MVKDDIGHQTGNDPKLLTLLDPATGKRAHPWLTDLATNTDVTAVVVIINTPPVSKLYRICIASGLFDEQFLIQLAHGQDDEATIALELARNEDAELEEDNGAEFKARIERNGAQHFECYAPGHVHWLIVLREESHGYCDPYDSHFEVQIVYIPSKSTWHPLLYNQRGEPKKITMFSVKEVNRAELFEVTTA
jgi:hypothetical protein